ncbi:3-deoxy-D-manno-octulosonic acid transferase [Sphingobacterium griseoflavum]|uniref:3-deoxy-D-manno-octulosonic acid transferase n=1 Tax=Sphingobacterium griseoflavum TaxID=1474952 RepID=A0ABQ3HV28_9SPHI|nr:glycosyltransferase N-terminal domain-containing protein [Sphingobacterium griseoflavum]GHE36693.1 3-deoxy-D-manno-octulosonic acid transferase [Sphingobacterium griseoflavum]
MRVLYDFGIGFYAVVLQLIAPFHPKAKLWVAGRRDLLNTIEQTIEPKQNPIWFHFASLGEFEQGRPVMEAIKKKYPQEKILVTFFSPSGYTIRRETPLADYVFYLPLDTARNARKFLDVVQPKFAVFTKYEYWYHYFRELHRRAIPLFMVSAIFREEQIFFQWYGVFFRKILRQVTFFFAQNMDAVHLLKAIHIKKAGLAGDTRFDRVAELPKSRKRVPAVEQFIAIAERVMVAGSTWPDDERILSACLAKHADWKLVLAPHEVTDSHLEQLRQIFPAALFYSEFAAATAAQIAAAQVLIIDNIGMLSSLYAYGQIAYVGGGFGAGIHNTLEAATYGMPVVFGPRYAKFQEAVDLIELGVGFSVHSSHGLHELMMTFRDVAKLHMVSQVAAGYVREKAGATQIVMKYLESQHFFDRPPHAE